MNPKPSKEKEAIAPSASVAEAYSRGWKDGQASALNQLLKMHEMRTAPSPVVMPEGITLAKHFHD